MTLRFGVTLTPVLDVERGHRLAAAVERAGLDLIGVQDHPYAPGLIDAYVHIGGLLSRTSRVTVFPDVTSLPLRPPAMLAYLPYERWAAANATIDRATEQPFTTFVLWPEMSDEEQVLRFGEEVVPAVVERLSLPRAVRPR